MFIDFIIGCLVLFIALLAAGVCPFTPRKAAYTRQTFILSLVFMIGGALGGLLLWVPVHVLIVVPLFKLVGQGAESMVIDSGLALFFPCFVVTGVVCVRGIADDMARSRQHKPGVEALTDK